jgi:hypothetical protein
MATVTIEPEKTITFDTIDLKSPALSYTQLTLKNENAEATTYEIWFEKDASAAKEFTLDPNDHHLYDLAGFKTASVVNTGKQNIIAEFVRA